MPAMLRWRRARGVGDPAVDGAKIYRVERGRPDREDQMRVVPRARDIGGICATFVHACQGTAEMSGDASVSKGLVTQGARCYEQTARRDLPSCGMTQPLPAKELTDRIRPGLGAVAAEWGVGKYGPRCCAVSTGSGKNEVYLEARGRRAKSPAGGHLVLAAKLRLTEQVLPPACRASVIGAKPAECIREAETTERRRIWKKWWGRAKLRW